MRRWMRAMTWPAATAAGLLALEVAFYFSAMAPMLHERATLRNEVMQLHQASAQSPEHATVRPDPSAELAQFYAALPRAASVPDLLRKLHRAARDQGLTLDQAEYRPLPDPDGGLTRYQILLPARGTYPDVRRFLVQAGGEIPGLAVDGINFQRQQIGDTALETQIKLTLFLGAPS
jgi:Tfp pilus assembly protein PilO